MSEKKKVLIICHSAAGQMYLGVLLNRIWYAPVLTKTPEEAVRMARHTAFSLVLYDGDAPESELMATVSLLRTEPSVKDVPLAVFLTDDDAGTNQSLLSQGCNAILTKPLDLAIVYGVLGRLSGQPRSAPRVPVKMRVEIEEGAPEKYLACINLSEGGIYLRTAAPLPEGTVIHVIFMLPHDTVPIELAAEVIRTYSLGTQLEAEPGMGLRFLAVSDAALLQIRNFVQWTMMGDLEWKSNL